MNVAELQVKSTAPMPLIAAGSPVRYSAPRCDDTCFWKDPAWIAEIDDTTIGEGE